MDMVTASSFSSWVFCDTSLAGSSVILHLQLSIEVMCTSYPLKSCVNLDALKREGKEEELRSWASFRGKILSRTDKGVLTRRISRILKNQFDGLYTSWTKVPLNRQRRYFVEFAQTHH